MESSGASAYPGRFSGRRRDFPRSLQQSLDGGAAVSLSAMLPVVSGWLPTVSSYIGATQVAASVNLASISSLSLAPCSLLSSLSRVLPCSVISSLLVLRSLPASCRLSSRRVSSSGFISRELHSAGPTMIQKHVWMPAPIPSEDAAGWLLPTQATPCRPLR